MDLVDRFVHFLGQSPTPMHAVANAAAALSRAGFVEVDEGGPPTHLAPGARGFLRRSGSLVAFRVGHVSPVEGGFRIVSAHTDSPNLRIKSNPVVRSHGLVRLGVEVYGGVLHATWTDRDLGLAGQVYVDAPEGVRPVLVDLRRPLCRIPNLAIHLQRGVNDDGLKLNPQTQLLPVLSLDGGGDGDPLRALLAAEIGVAADAILSWDLMAYDLQAPTVGGADGAFIYSGRLDNLTSTHAAIEAMLPDASPASTAIIALFDHEEVGSLTSRGAQSRLLEGVLERLVRDGPGNPEGGLPRALAHSVHLSADAAHAVHPGWPDKHDANHMPKLGAGVVIKQNASQRYGTEGATAALVLRLLKRHNLPFQWFINRADLACGTTVGPIVAAQLGVPTCDVGSPMFSMHSAREMCGSADHAVLVGLMRAFLAGEA